MNEDQYPTLEEVLHSEHELLDGTTVVAKVNLKGKSYIYKSLGAKIANNKKNISPQIIIILRKLDQKINRFLLQQQPVEKYRDLQNWFNDEELINRLEKWDSLGVPTSSIIAIKDYSIIIKNVGNKNMKETLTAPTYKKQEIKSFIHTSNLIRELAKKTHDELVIHPDAWPKNFVYNEEEEQTYAIDSGGRFKSKLSFDEKIGAMNLQLIWGIYSLNTPHAKTYTKEIINSLDTKEKEQVKKMNIHANTFTTTYFTLRESIVTLIKDRDKIDFSKQYAKEKVEQINDYLSSN